MARPGLSGHRKFRRLARALGSQIMARGALELLWDACYESGDENVGTAEDIEHAVGWTGEKGMLTQALADAGAPTGVGFIERLEGVTEPVYRVHDLWHHAPDYVAKRRRRELERQGKADPGTRPPNGGQCLPLSSSQDGDGRPPSPSPSPSPSHGKNGSADEPAPTFLAYPCVGRIQSFQLSETQVVEWVGLYPNVAVRAECRKALGWLIANPRRRKSEGGMPRFLVNWLNRAVDERRGESRARGASEPRRAAPLPATPTCTHSPACPPSTPPHVCDQRETFGDRRWRELYPAEAAKVDWLEG